MNARLKRTLKILTVLLLLYTFLASIKLMESSFKLFGHDVSGRRACGRRGFTYCLCDSGYHGPIREKKPMTAQQTASFEVFLQEGRNFPPSKAFREAAHVRDEAIYERAASDPEALWADWAKKKEQYEEIEGG